jgi:hypothetical protein
VRLLDRPAGCSAFGSDPGGGRRWLLTLDGPRRERNPYTRKDKLTAEIKANGFPTLQTRSFSGRGMKQGHPVN